MKCMYDLEALEGLPKLKERCMVSVNHVKDLIVGHSVKRMKLGDSSFESSVAGDCT
ncbi:uncharacterized protein NFIA_024130 [Aspergillus fischeri NRRL 181]|uniref:Uncharacterized protein n=1 Tax=Neosartorya fischeri (strain ATCC 1020 / DSM 3700 / CBS 544.65 / FGSC A1164 / JCM 1740 / NRRL 181 / WB 181) TaxID=331117 RepID=A1D5I0_NEOFI|nr:uncharacterized protein NFIA_024130 [Aspergillus fischeri NRRL 181]EAW22034.1 hypothetical protein NFIA_024130 [Aspergillus fischeri NRRL 181]